MLLIATIYVIGVSLAIDYWVNKLILAYGRPENATGAILETGTFWLLFWVSAASYGVIRGAMQWFIGGWWYNVRIEWCLADLMVEHNKRLGREIYMYNQLFYALPNVALYLVLTIFCTNFFGWLDLSAAVRIGVVLLLGACSLMTAFYSYKRVRVHFEMDHKKTLTWFLILPLFVLGMQTFGLVYLMSVL